MVVSTFPSHWDTLRPGISTAPGNSGLGRRHPCPSLESCGTSGPRQILFETLARSFDSTETRNGPSSFKLQSPAIHVSWTGYNQIPVNPRFTLIDLLFAFRCQTNLMHHFDAASDADLTPRIVPYVLPPTIYCQHHTTYMSDGLRKTGNNPVVYGGFADM